MIRLQGPLTTLSMQTKKSQSALKRRLWHGKLPVINPEGTHLESNSLQKIIRRLINHNLKNKVTRIWN